MWTSVGSCIPKCLNCYGNQVWMARRKPPKVWFWPTRSLRGHLGIKDQISQFSVERSVGIALVTLILLNNPDLVHSKGAIHVGQSVPSDHSHTKSLLWLLFLWRKCMLHGCDTSPSGCLQNSHLHCNDGSMYDNKWHQDLTIGMTNSVWLETDHSFHAQNAEIMLTKYFLLYISVPTTRCMKRCRPRCMKRCRNQNFPTYLVYWLVSFWLKWGRWTTNQGFVWVAEARRCFPSTSQTRTDFCPKRSQNALSYLWLW